MSTCDDCDRFDEAGDQCHVCRGHGGGEDWRGDWHECSACDGSGVAS